MIIVVLVLGVEFYSSENPGPFGIPTIQKISGYSEHLRNWDPSDDNKSNPWIVYKQELKAKEEKERKEQEEKKRYYNAAIQATINIIDIAI